MELHSHRLLNVSVESNNETGFYFIAFRNLAVFFWHHLSQIWAVLFSRRGPMDPGDYPMQSWSGHYPGPPQAIQGYSQPMSYPNTNSQAGPSYSGYPPGQPYPRPGDPRGVDPSYYPHPRWLHPGNMHTTWVIRNYYLTCWLFSFSVFSAHELDSFTPLNPPLIFYSTFCPLL